METESQHETINVGSVKDHHNKLVIEQRLGLVEALNSYEDECDRMA